MRNRRTDSFINIASLMAALLCLLIPVSARADMYSCKDSAGHVVTSDRPIPECADKPVQVFKENGVLKDQITAPLNAEQRRAAELLEKQRAADALQKENLSREQRFLVAHYPNEQSIELARKKEIGTIEAKIATEKNNIETATDTLNKNEALLPTLPKNNPVKINETIMKIASMKMAMEESNRLIQNYQIEESNVNHQYDETHLRYVEVVLANKH